MRTWMPCTLPHLLLLASCATGIGPLFEQAKTAALAEPGPLPPNWEPDVLLHLSGPQTVELTRTLLEAYGTFDDNFSTAVLGVSVNVAPDLRVKRVDFSPSKRCPSCIGVDARVAGNVRVTAAGQSTSAPLDVRAAIDLELDAHQGDAGWTVRAIPRDLRSLDIDVAGLGASLGESVQRGLRDWFRAQVLEKLEPLEVASFGSPDVPIRALRAEAVPGGGLDIGLLTRSPSPTPVHRGPSPATGFSLQISDDSLLDLARAAAFRYGPVSHDIVAEPTSLSIDGQRFAMGIRLWKPVGTGWWRDYSVDGEMQKAVRGIKLIPKNVSEGDKSAGATLADPLAALAEGLILKSLEDAVATSLPDRRTTHVDTLKNDVRVQSVSGYAGDLLVTGMLSLTRVKGERPHPDRVPD